MLLPDIGYAIEFFLIGGASSVLLVCLDVVDEVLEVGNCIHPHILGFRLLLPLRIKSSSPTSSSLPCQK